MRVWQTNRISMSLGAFFYSKAQPFAVFQTELSLSSGVNEIKQRSTPQLVYHTWNFCFLTEFIIYFVHGNETQLTVCCSTCDDPSLSLNAASSGTSCEMKMLMLTLVLVPSLALFIVLPTQSLNRSCLRFTTAVYIRGRDFYEWRKSKTSVKLNGS